MQMKIALEARKEKHIRTRANAINLKRIEPQHRNTHWPGDDRVIGITANPRNSTSNNLWSR